MTLSKFLKLFRACVVLLVIGTILLYFCSNFMGDHPLCLITALKVKPPEDCLSLTDYITKIIFPICAGVAVLAGLYLTYKRTMALEQQAATMFKQMSVTIQQTSQMNRQITTNAFKNAVDQLGSTNPTIVIAGIYALHKIATDEKDEYAHTVANILCGYVKEKTNLKAYRNEVRTRRQDMQKKLMPGVVADQSVQTIINLLFRDKTERKVYDECRQVDVPGDEWWVNLSGAFLCGTTLYEADLTNVDLWQADLRGVSLHKADISGADLGYANMQAARLYETILSDLTNLGNTKLEGVQSQENLHPHMYIKQGLSILATDFSGVIIKESRVIVNTQPLQWIWKKQGWTSPPGCDAISYPSLAGEDLEQLLSKLGYK